MSHECSDLDHVFDSATVELFRQAKCTFEFLSGSSVADSDFLAFLLQKYRFSLDRNSCLESIDKQQEK